MTITFDDTTEAKKLFIAIWVGWTRGAELQGKEQVMLGNEVTKKLMALADVAPDSIRLQDTGGVLELTPREFRILRLHCEAASFPPQLAADAARMYEAFEEAAESPRLTLHDRPA